MAIIAIYGVRGNALSAGRKVNRECRRSASWRFADGRASRISNSRVSLRSACLRSEQAVPAGYRAILAITSPTARRFPMLLSRFTGQPRLIQIEFALNLAQQFIADMPSIAELNRSFPLDM